MGLSASPAEPDVALSLPARPENVAVVRQALAGLADALGVEVALVADMKIALTEACTNAVLHAYEATDGPLEVTMAVDARRRLTISVRDRGTGFKPLPTPVDEAPLGFGLALIASLADAFAIQGGPGGTEVQMAFGLELDGEDGAPPPAVGQLLAARPEPRGADVDLVLCDGPLVAPVLSRVVSLLAARVDFSIDRLSDAQIVADVLAQHTAAQAADGHVHVSIAEEDRALALAVGPLAAGGGKALVAATELPGLGRLLDQLASQVDIDPGPEGEILRLRLGERAGA